MKPKDILEFIRVMIASILAFVHHIADMLRDLVDGVRAMIRTIAGAIRDAVMAVIRSVEDLVRAVGRRIRAFGSVIYKSIRAFVHMIRSSVMQLYYSHILPPIHRVQRYFRYLKRRVRIAVRAFIESLRYVYNRTNAAFLKIVRFVREIIIRAATWVWKGIVGIFTRIARFFRAIARAFHRLAWWGARLFVQFIHRLWRAFERSGPLYLLFVIVGIAGYWYIFINTYHRITALIFSFIVYHITIEAIILPFFLSAIASIIAWINKYHPILALVKRTGLAFARVWITTIAVIAAGRFYITNRTRRAFARSRVSLGIFSRRLIGIIARVIIPPLSFVASIAILAFSKIRHGWFVLTLYIWLEAHRFRDRIFNAFRAIARVCLWLMAQVMNGLISIARRIAALIRLALHIMLQGLIYIGGLVKALGLAIYAGLRAVWAKVLIVLGLIISVAAVIGNAILYGLKAIARAVRFVGHTIKHVIIVIGTAILAVLSIIARTIRTVWRFLVSTIRKAWRILTNVILAIMRGIWSITIAIVSAIWFPIRRSIKAFSRTWLTLITGVVLIGTLILTGLYTTLLRILMPIGHFLLRNVLAIQRVSYTIQVLTVRFVYGMSAVILSIGRFIVGSIVGAGKWIIAQAHLHYQGIKDLSIAFAPNLILLALYLLLGGTILYILTISYIPGIISLSYGFKRYKGVETNV